MAPGDAWAPRSFSGKGEFLFPPSSPLDRRAGASAALSEPYPSQDGCRWFIIKIILKSSHGTNRDNLIRGGLSKFLTCLLAERGEMSPSKATANVSSREKFRARPWGPREVSGLCCSKPGLGAPGPEPPCIPPLLSWDQVSKSPQQAECWPLCWGLGSKRKLGGAKEVPGGGSQGLINIPRAYLQSCSGGPSVGSALCFSFPGNRKMLPQQVVCCLFLLGGAAGGGEGREKGEPAR